MQPLWKMVWRFLKKIKIELPHDPVIPLLGICLEKHEFKNIHAPPMSTAALFAIAKTRKRKQLVFIARGMDKKDVRYIYIYTYIYIYMNEYYSAIKKNETMLVAATWMDLKIIIVSAVRQRKTNIIYHLHVESKKRYKLTYYTKQK